MSKRGRPNGYFTKVEPRLDEIKKWLEEGATEKEIAESLGLTPSMFCTYKREFPQFAQIIKKGRRKPVQNIKAALYRRAVGFQYVEEVETIKGGVVVQKQRIAKSALPDPTSALILLKHWDDEVEWTQDPAMLKLKKEELKLKREKFEAGEEDWE